MKISIVISMVMMASLCFWAGDALADKVQLTFDHFYDDPAVTAALQRLHQAYPHLTDLRSIGKSEEGRDIWLLTINNPKTGTDTEKPGIYVDGTIHGNEIQSTEVCLYLAWYLLDSYGTLKPITDVVDSRAFYIIPTVNVDSRARFFTDPSDYNSVRSSLVPFDDDRDGLFDEDNFDDLDGDGEILRMRIRDPYGEYKTDPEDPRAMIRVRQGEKGEWRLLGEEGFDNDGDGQVNEDGPGYLDMNRNYGFKWQPPYIQGGAGEYPMSGNATRAIADLVLSKPNICFDFAFHNAGRLFVRGPGSKLAGMYAPSDVQVYDYLGEEGEKIVPGYKYIIGSVDMYTTHGDFDEFMYSNLGIYGFVSELYSSEQETFGSPDEPKEDDGASYWGRERSTERLKFNDRLTQGQMFREWKAFHHPQFGDIEIGGWRSFTSRIPQPFMLQELVHRHASMVIFTATQTPQVSLELIDIKDLGGGLKRVRVRADNPKAMPSLSTKAMRSEILRPDIFRLEGGGVEVVSGGIIEDIVFDRVSFVEYRPWMILTNVPSFGRRDIQWIVRGTGSATVTYDAMKAANQSLTIKL